MELGGDVHNSPTTGVRDQNESRVPFDIENGYTINKRHSSSARTEYLSPSERNTGMELGGDAHNSLCIGVRDQNESLVPFDTENGYIINKRYASRPNDEYQSPYKRDTGSPVSVVYVLKALLLILFWYTFSMLLTLYNKTLLGHKLGKFPAPLLMNTIHFVMQGALSTTIMWSWSDGFNSSVMSWKDYFFRVVPTALSTAMDVNLSNASLISISVTFATMCKSASPIFLLIFAVAFRLESPSVKLFGIILVISVGILLTVAKETEFEFLGFVLVMLAAVMAGFRWTMTQILLQKEEYGLKNPLRLMSYVAPVMAIATALCSLLLDPWHDLEKSDYFDSSRSSLRSCFLMLFGGTLAFFMVLTEYVLVLLTSAVTVTIAGVVKEAVTILVAVFYFHDEFTPLKGVGLVTIMTGVCLFNWYKYQKLRKSKKNVGLPKDGAASEYVILGETDEEEDSPCFNK